MTQKPEKIQIRDLGTMDYKSCWDLQKQYHSDLVQEKSEPLLLFVQHPRVITCGRNAGEESLLVTKEQLKANSVDYYKIDRGGDLTAHEPGQLVMYPIIPINKLGLTPKKYIHLLEQAVIDTLKQYEITASRDDSYPGIWVGQNKVCAVGVRIKDRVSLHGIGFNVNNDLSTFQYIVPCGIHGRGITTLERLCGKKQDIGQLIDRLGRTFSESLPFITGREKIGR